MIKLFWDFKKFLNFSTLAISILFLLVNLMGLQTAFADDPAPDTTANPTTQPSAQPSETPAPNPSTSPQATSTPQPTNTPAPSESPTSTPQPTSNPTSSPSVAPSATPAPSTSPTPDPSATPAPSATPDPNNSPAPSTSPTPSASSTPAPTAVTTPTVSLNTPYTYSNMKVIFTNLPSTPGSITFTTKTLDSSQVDQLKALTNTVYEVSSSMANGSFNYDLTLPLPAGVTGTNFKVFYASDVTGLNSPTQVSESITNNGDGTFTIHNLNHFTVFVVVNPNSQANCDAITVGTTPGSTCYTTVQAAVNAAVAGDTINIGNTGSPYNETVYVNKQLTLTGSGNPSVTAFVLQTTPVTITGITTSVSIATPTVSLTNPVNNGNQTTASITGTGAANATVNYTISGTSGSPITGTGTVSAGGNINISVNVSALGEGALTLTVNLTSGSYSSSNATANAFKDTTGPANATGLTITNPINIGNNTSISFSGNGEAGTTVNWTLSNGASTQTGTTTVSGAGTFSVTGRNISTFPDGTITLTVTLTDSAGNTSSASTVTATKDTVAPTVFAGSNTTRNSGFTTSATASDAAPSSGGLTYSWVKTSGPGTITFGTPSSLNTTVSASADGTYVLTLTVTDGAGNSNSSNFTLVWDTIAPTVSGLTNSTTNTAVTKTGVVTDPAPSSGGLTYLWSQITGPGTITFGSPTSLTSTISASADGTYTLKLTATDSAGNSGSQTITLVWDTTNPTVSAGANQVKNSVFTQTGTASDALSGVATTVWSTVSGPGTITFGTPNALTTTISASLDGTYVIRLTVVDNAGNSNNSTFTLTWDTTNPTVSAGTNVTTNGILTQTGTASDSLSGVATTVWSQVSGPGTITFGTPNSLTTTITTFSASADGVYVIKLTVTDNAGNTNNSTFTLTWDVTNPTVSAGTSVQNKNAVFTQVGSASDSLSGISSVTWSKISGPGTITFGSSSSLNTSVSASADGTYVIQLTVTDGAGNSASSTFTLVWDTVLPTVNAGTNVSKNALFTTTATASDSAPSSGIASYLWSVVSGPGTITFGSSSSLNTTISASVDGTYVIRLTVVDNAGNSNNSTFTLVWDTVVPTVNAGSNVVTNALFTQTGVVTDAAPSSGSLTYLWSQVSGPGTITFGSSNAVVTTVSASADGAYVIRLTATDASGNSNNSTFNLTWDTTMPTVSAGANQVKNAIFTQTGTVNDPIPSSGIASIVWSQVSGPGSVTFGTPNAAVTTMTANADGTYVLKLTVTDNAGNSNNSTFTLVWDTVVPTVSAGANQIKNAIFTQTGTSTDPAPSSGGVTYVWSKVSGPGNLTFGSVNSLVTTISANVDGAYVIQLTATDSAGNTNSSTFTLDWDTVAPNVSAGTNQLKNALFTQTGVVTDPAPSSGGLVYAWTKVSGPGTVTFGAGSSLSTTISANTDGAYVIQLTATDAAGNSTSSNFTLTWDTTAPTASWTTPVVNSTVSGTVALTTTATDTNGVATVTFLYQRNDGVDTFHTITTVNSGPFNTNWNASGLALDNYTLRITVTDTLGNSTNVDRIVALATVINQATIQTGSVSTSGIVITWTTADPTGSRVIFDTVSHPTLGTAPNYGYASSTANFDVSPHVLNHSVTLSGLNASTTYYYRTVSSGSPESVSSEFSFTTSSVQQASSGSAAGPSAPGAPGCDDLKPGGAPTLLSVKFKNGKLVLTWSKAKDPVTYYLIKYGLGHDSYQFGVPNTGNVTEYEIGGLEAGVTYYFRVRAGNGCNTNGEYSNELSAKAGSANIAAEVINVTSNLLGVKEAFAADENKSIISEATQSGVEASTSASSFEVSPSPKTEIKKSSANPFKNILVTSGIILLITGGAFYYSTLQKKQ